MGRPAARLSCGWRAGILVPGFVDLQVNGYYGVELADMRPDEWQLVASRLPETGTTAFMPTFITAPVSRLARALQDTPAVATAAAGAGRPGSSACTWKGRSSPRCGPGRTTRTG